MIDTSMEDQIHRPHTFALRTPLLLYYEAQQSNGVGNVGHEQEWDARAAFCFLRVLCCMMWYVQQYGVTQ